MKKMIESCAEDFRKEIGDELVTIIINTNMDGTMLHAHRSEDVSELMYTFMTLKGLADAANKFIEMQDEKGVLKDRERICLEYLNTIQKVLLPNYKTNGPRNKTPYKRGQG